MSHYDCSKCGTYMCGGECVERNRKAAKKLADKLERLGLTKKDLELIERAITVSELLLPDIPYSKGIILNELIRDLKKRLE